MPSRRRPPAVNVPFACKSCGKDVPASFITLCFASNRFGSFELPCAECGWINRLPMIVDLLSFLLAFLIGLAVAAWLLDSTSTPVVVLGAAIFIFLLGTFRWWYLQSHPFV